MDFRKEIIKFIEKKKETELCDFKVEFYSAIKYGDLIKDIVAFANNMRDKNKYIVFGVDDKGEVVGIDKSPLPEIATINQLLNEYVESFIDTRIERFKYYDTGKEIAALIILQSNKDRPYMLKKDYHKNNYKLNNGACFVRKGTTNAVATRDDFNKMYGISKGSQELTKEDVQKEAKLEYDFHRYINREYDLKENPELIRKHFEFLIANPEKNKEIPKKYGLHNVCKIIKTIDYFDRKYDPRFQYVALALADFNSGKFTFAVTIQTSPTWDTVYEQAGEVTVQICFAKDSLRFCGEVNFNVKKEIMQKHSLAFMFTNEERKTITVTRILKMIAKLFSENMFGEEFLIADKYDNKFVIRESETRKIMYFSIPKTDNNEIFWSSNIEEVEVEEDDPIECDADYRNYKDPRRTGRW